MSANRNSFVNNRLDLPRTRAFIFILRTKYVYIQRSVNVRGKGSLKLRVCANHLIAYYQLPEQSPINGLQLSACNLLPYVKLTKVSCVLSKGVINGTTFIIAKRIIVLTLDTKHSFCYIKRTDHWNQTAAEMCLMLSLEGVLYN